MLRLTLSLLLLATSSCGVEFVAGGAPGVDRGGSDSGAAATGGNGGAAGGAGTTGGAPAGGAGGGAGGPGNPTMAAIDGVRIEIPCTMPVAGTPEGCEASETQATYVVDGDPAASYQVTLRIRGVAEQNAYIGGTANDPFYVGGAPDNAGWNEYRLDVSAPAGVFYLNAGQSGILQCWPLDYEATIPIDGGATLTLTADAKDGVQVRNRDAGDTPITIAGIITTPHPYDGQWIQLDVVSVD